MVADIQPFRGILFGLFFMTVGMSIERQAVLDHGLMLLALALALMALKTLAAFAVMRAFRIPAGDALHGALLLSQTGEFALILFALAAGENLISATERQMLYQVVVFSMLLTPLADLLGRRLAGAMPRPAEASHAPGAVPETIEYSLQFGLAALSELGVDAAYRQELEDALRADEYTRLLNDPPSR